MVEYSAVNAVIGVPETRGSSYSTFSEPNWKPSVTRSASRSTHDSARPMSQPSTEFSASKSFPGAASSLMWLSSDIVQ